jgi:hypothetical protein
LNPETLLRETPGTELPRHGCGAFRPTAVHALRKTDGRRSRTVSCCWIARAQSERSAHLVEICSQIRSHRAMIECGKRRKSLFRPMTPAGLEPAASGLGIPRSIRLSYGAVDGTLLRVRTRVQLRTFQPPRHHGKIPERVFPRDKPGATFERQVGPGPTRHDPDPVPESDQVEDMD